MNYMLQVVTTRTMKYRHYLYYLTGATLGWLVSIYLMKAPDWLKPELDG